MNQISVSGTEVIITMNLGKITRGAAVAVFTISALTANAQTVSMWWNKSGDAATAQPGTVDVLAGSTVTLSFYLTTAGFTGNLTTVGAMVGFDTTNTTGNGAVAAGSGITVAHGGTNAAPTGVPITWNTSTFAGGAVLNGFGGGFDGSAATRPFGLWTSNLNLLGDYGFSSTSNTKMFDLTFTVDGSLTAGTLRPITIFSVPSLPGAWDSEVGDVNSVMAAPQTYTANLRIVNPVPEPASFAALSVGALVLLRRRKK